MTGGHQRHKRGIPALSQTCGVERAGIPRLSLTVESGRQVVKGAGRSPGERPGPAEQTGQGTAKGGSEPRDQSRAGSTRDTQRIHRGREGEQAWDGEGGCGRRARWRVGAAKAEWGGIVSWVQTEDALEKGLRVSWWSQGWRGQARAWWRRNLSDLI